MGVAGIRTVSPTLIVSIEGVITTWMTWLAGGVGWLLQAKRPAAAPRAKSVRIAARMKASPQAMDQTTGTFASSQSQRRAASGVVNEEQLSITHRAARTPGRPPSRGAPGPSTR